MKNFEIARTIGAPRSSVWDVLADYPNIADWNDGVINSHAIGGTTEGVGARRQCELAGSVTMRETVTAWTPEERMVIDIDEIVKMPVKKATMTFALETGGKGTTSMTMSYDYEPKGGPFGFIVAAMLARPMGKGFNGFVDDLERAAQTRTSA